MTGIAIATLATVSVTPSATSATIIKP